MNTNIHLNRPKWRLAAKHYKQYEDYNYITYTVICISDRI